MSVRQRTYNAFSSPCSTAPSHAQLTTQNTASSEQLAATSQEMNGQALQLQSTMEFFRVTGSEPAASAQASNSADPSSATRAGNPADTSSKSPSVRPNQSIAGKLRWTGAGSNV